MAKFLDKKERVIDFQLTPYGKHRLSVGKLKPTHYAFFDTGVLYDSEYAGFKETQTKIHERIKDETQFLEGILMFDEAENTTPEGDWRGESSYYGVRFLKESGASWLSYGGDVGDIAEPGSALYNYLIYSAKLAIWEDLGYTREHAEAAWSGVSMGSLRSYGYLEYLYEDTSLFDLDIVPKKHVPKPNILSFDSSIGDARFEGDSTQTAPAWKLLTCQGEISNVATKDTSKYNFTSAMLDMESKEFNIPQIDVTANYTLEISSPTTEFQAEVPSDFVSETQQFADGNTIKLLRNDVMVYAEEMNTELLTENFDIEVFEIIENVGLEIQAEATIEMGDSVTIGDTITIGDGITTETFQFIRNDITHADGIAAAGNIGVVVSSNYFAGAKNRKGTLLNFLSALNQDDGSTSRDYPTDHDKDEAGHTAKGRCKGDEYPAGCYVGNHNLQISFSSAEIMGIYNHVFSGGAYSFSLVNNNITVGYPNYTITSTAATSRLNPSGFTGGSASSSRELKRKHFIDSEQQIVDGFMRSATKEIATGIPITEDAVEYYFSILTDDEVSAKIACSCASTFNRDSYYIDVDFNCTEEDMETVYYDIYGSATAPEICDLPSLAASAGNPFSEVAPTVEEGCEDE